MKTFIQWLVYSSVDADKISATLKGLAGFIPSLAVFLVAVHLKVTPDTLLAVLNGIILVISAISGLATAIVTVAGAVRKLYTTASGTNAVLNG